jgi:hypothetical protein
VIEVGLNAAVAPEGNPVTLSVTLPVKPLTTVVFAVYVVLPPAVTVSVAGDDDIVKFVPVTTSVAVVVSVRSPLVALMVKV